MMPFFKFSWLDVACLESLWPQLYLLSLHLTILDLNQIHPPNERAHAPEKAATSLTTSNFVNLKWSVFFG